MIDDMHIDRHPLALHEQVGNKDWRDGNRMGCAYHVFLTGTSQWTVHDQAVVVGTFTGRCRVNPNVFGTLGEAVLRAAFCVRNETAKRPSATNAGT